MTAAATPPDERTLIDKLLAEQQELPAAARFARRPGADALPAQARYYRDLIPLTAPRPGEQYAFEVDLDKCSGCKACVTACHNLNGLDEDETWRSVGLLFSDNWRAPSQATITTACHHCVDPACLTGCPVLAYDKDPATGIVHHLDDQCIGCQYCVMKCPYEVPQYSATRGIVRKCDMCSSRLAQNEAPACVQACPSQAIRITLVDKAGASRRFRETFLARKFGARVTNPFLPASPAPDYTVPTTRYKSSRPLPGGLLAGDHARIVPGPAHLPLVFMLVLSQLAVGASCAAVFVSRSKSLSLLGIVAGAGALAVGTLHLGQPLKAWRAFLGWRTSWFSREVIVFGAFIFFAFPAAAAACFAQLAAGREPAAVAAAATGLLLVVCSAMIYADTRREFWRAGQSLGKFMGTTFVLGSASALAATLFASPGSSGQTALPATLLALGTLVKLAFEARVLRHLVEGQAPAPTPLNKTARLLAGELGVRARLRVFLGAAGGLFLPLLLGLNQAAGGHFAAPLALGILALCLSGELLERSLFFTAVAPVKMPGGPAE